MRPRRCLWMILDGKGRQPAVPDSFHGVVVEIDVGDVYGITAQTFHINGKSMILGGNLHPPRIQVLDWLIGSPMAELEFVSSSPQSQPQNNSDSNITTGLRFN